MGAWAAAVGRWLSCVGVAVGLASFCARALITSSWGPSWMAIPAFAVEGLGLAAAAALVWAAWSARSPRPALDDRLRTSVEPSVEIVVRVGLQGTQSVRATLIAARELGAPTMLLDLRSKVGRRRAIRAVAEEYGARYLAAEAGDDNGLALAASASTAGSLLLLDAGDVPSPAIVDRLRPLLARPGVAIAQGIGTLAAGDSPEEIGSGRSERDFERTVLNSWLGRRGAAVFTGSGALVRRSLLAEAAPLTTSPAMAEAEVTAALFASHWNVVTSDEPLVALRPPSTPHEWENANASRAAAARHLVLGLHGALRPNRLALRHRLALVAWSVRPLSGARRGLFLALVIACLIAGRVPMNPTPAQTVGTIAFFVLTPLGLGLASGWVLQPGDRCRFSMRTLGSSWRGLLSPNGRVADPRRGLAGSVGVDHEVASAASLALLGVALAMRGLSDRVTHTLHTLPNHAEVGLLVVALWLLAVAIESQRLFVGAAHTRGAARVGGRLRGEIAEAATPCAERTPVAITDLTVLGASAICAAEMPVGTALVADVELPDLAGGLRHFSIRSTVRHAESLRDGRTLHGLEFTGIDRPTADALVRYCVVRPALAALAPETVAPARRPALAPSLAMADTHASRRAGLRATALVAVVGAVASAGPVAPPAGGMLVLVASALIGVGVTVGSFARRPQLVEARVQSAASPDFAMR